MLLAQARLSGPELFSELMTSPAVIALVVLAVLFLGVMGIVGMSLRHVRKKREMLHVERMKALDGGQPIQWSETPPESAQAAQQNEYLSSAFWIAFWVGAVVPIAGFAAVATAVSKPVFQTDGPVYAAWISAAVVSVAAVISAAVIMNNSRRAT